MQVHSVRIWLDDLRPMPSSFNVHCKTASEAIELLNKGNVQAISFDHDLGVDGGTGYQVASFIEKEAKEGTLESIDQMTIHSANPVGRQNIKYAIRNAMKFWAQNEMM